MWPKTIMAADVTIDESAKQTFGDFDYVCKGSDGNLYAKIRENAGNSGSKYSDGSTVRQYVEDSYRWFKIEPIRWRALTNDYGGNKLLLAEDLLLAKRFDASSNNWQNSEIQKWLNSNSNCDVGSDHTSETGFWQTAFDTISRKQLKTVSVDGIADSVFFLSQGELSTSAYGFAAANERDDEARKRSLTDYAYANGAFKGQERWDNGGSWWTRAPCSDSGKVMFVRYSMNEANWEGAVTEGRRGVVPAVCVAN